MLNLDIIHGIPRVGGGRFGFIATATTPSSPEVEKVQAETMAKKGAEASSKRPTEGVTCPRKKVKVSSNRHKSRHEEEGSKSHASKSKERVGAIDGTALVEHKRGTLILRLAVDKYCSPFEVLIDRVLKTMMLALTDHLKVELEEVSHRRESLELDLDNSRFFLADS
ncbi:hypothetical protein BHE74_00032989 [Ensete ventricosum]|nr:hypothetical protein BHE74_00032989 [Ensete ventricosum]